MNTAVNNQSARGINLRTSPVGCVVDMIPEMLTIQETAKRTGLSYDFLRKGCLSGKIIHIRAGNKFLINFGKLLEWLNTSTGEPMTEASGNRMEG